MSKKEKERTATPNWHITTSASWRLTWWRHQMKHFPRYWPFLRGIHRSPVNSPHKGQRRGSLMYSLLCAWINDWVNNREAGDLRRYRAHYDVIVMKSPNLDFNGLFGPTPKKTSNPHYSLLWGEPPLTDRFPCKVMPKGFPCHDVILTHSHVCANQLSV